MFTLPGDVVILNQCHHSQCRLCFSSCTAFIQFYLQLFVLIDNRDCAVATAVSGTAVFD